MLEIQEKINLAKYSTFGTGGEADYFVKVANEKELQEALTFSKDNNLPIYILGGGSNVIFSDNGFSGLIVKLDSEEMAVDNESIKVSAGVFLIKLVEFAKNNSLSGLENLAGIPGTVGGAIYGNAGAFGTEIADLVEKVSCFDLEKNQLVNFSKADCVFSYRSSLFKKNKHLIIVSATLGLRKGLLNEIESKMAEIMENRGNKQPKDWKGSSGSFFKNPKVNDNELLSKFAEEKGARAKDDKLPAGWLIERAGLLGKEIGKIKVSEKNGNFILNTGGAKSEDLIIMLSFIKQQVRDKFGVQLEEEVQLVGFN